MPGVGVFLPGFNYPSATLFPYHSVPESAAEGPIVAGEKPPSLAGQTGSMH